MVPVVVSCVAPAAAHNYWNQKKKTYFYKTSSRMHQKFFASSFVFPTKRRNRVLTFLRFLAFFSHYNFQISINYNQPQEIADGFGRHSVDVMEKSYLLPEKSTRAISAYNLIREMGDTMGFDEKNKISNFRQQKKILANVRNNPSLKRKRSSLEILNDSNLANSPPKSTTARTISLSQIPQECSPSMQLTQNVTNIQNIGTIASGNKNNMKFEILKKLMQQQQQNAEDERIARERFEDRQRKNQQQFNEMLLKYL